MKKDYLKNFFKNKEINYVDIGANVGNYLEFIKKISKLKRLIVLNHSLIYIAY